MLRDAGELPTGSLESVLDPMEAATNWRGEAKTMIPNWLSKLPRAGLACHQCGSWRQVDTGVCIVCLDCIEARDAMTAALGRCELKISLAADGQQAA